MTVYDLLTLWNAPARVFQDDGVKHRWKKCLLVDGLVDVCEETQKEADNMIQIFQIGTSQNINFSVTLLQLLLLLLFLLLLSQLL